MKKLVFWSIVALAVFSLSNARVGAAEPKQDADYQDDPATVSSSDIEDLNNKVTELSKSARVGVFAVVRYTNAGGNGLLPKGFSTPIKASAQTGENYTDLFTGKTEISLNGDLVDKKIVAKVQYDPLAPTTAKPGVTNGEQLKDFWVRALYIPYADFQFGQYKYAQALEGRTPLDQLDFNNTALITTALEARRDFAFQVSGAKIPVGTIQLEYAAAIVQGSGQNAGADNNEVKDYALRAGITVTDPDFNIYLGGSAYSGLEAYPGPTTVVSGVLKRGWSRNNTGLEARVNAGRLKVQGEYIQGQLEPGNYYNPWDGLTLAKAKLSNPLGWYATVSYRLDDFRLGVRGESYNADTTVGSKYNVNNDVATVGLDWFQGKDKFKLSLNFEEHFAQYEAIIGQAQVNI